MSLLFMDKVCAEAQSKCLKSSSSSVSVHLCPPQGVSDIKPMPAMEKILSEFKTFATDTGAIFFVVALYSYERLMNWLAEQLNETQKNPYYFWKIENLFLDIKEHYKKLLDHHLKTNEQIQKAEQMFRQQMQNEQNFFASFPPKNIKIGGQLTADN